MKSLLLKLLIILLLLFPINAFSVSTDANPIPKKNVAFRVTFTILDSDGDLVTGAAGLDSECSGDAGAFADCTNEATEIATSSGMYYLELTTGEMNYNTVSVIVKTTTTDAKTTPIVMYPSEKYNLIDKTRCDVSASTSSSSFTIATCVARDGTSITIAEGIFEGTMFEAYTNGGSDCNVIGEQVLIEDVTGAGVVTLYVDDFTQGDFTATPSTTNCGVNVVD